MPIYTLAAWVCRNVDLRFSLSRLFQLTLVVAVVCALFAALKWPLALLALSGMNAVACVRFWLTRRTRVALMALATSVFMLAALLFTDWGFSTPRPVVRVAWPHLVAACVWQLATMLFWLVSVPPGTRPTHEDVE